MRKAISSHVIMLICDCLDFTHAGWSNTIIIDQLYNRGGSVGDEIDMKWMDEWDVGCCNRATEVGGDGGGLRLREEMIG